MATPFGFSDLFDEYSFAFPSIAPEDDIQNVPVSILAPALPDLAYLYELFENPSAIQEIENALGLGGYPFASPSIAPEDALQNVPVSILAPASPPQIDSPVGDAARACTIYSVQTPLPPPAPAPGQNATDCPTDWRKIPQTDYGLGQKRWDYRPSEPILFHVNGRPGVNMGDVLRNEFMGLDGRDDLMFQDGVDAFSCRLMFPGYPLNSKPQIFTRHWNKDRDPITRSTLAYHVARKLEHYLGSMASSHSINNSTDKRWEIGKGFMTLDNMFLVRLEHVSKGSYQPEIRVAM